MHIVRDSHGCREFAEQLIKVSAKYDFPITRTVGSFMLGAAQALQGDIAPALKQMEPSYEATLGYGFSGILPGVIMAETLASADRDQEALALVMRLLDKSITPEAAVFIPELWRNSRRDPTAAGGHQLAGGTALFRNRATHCR